MAKCPKCKLEFTDDTKKCPNCHTVINKKTPNKKIKKNEIENKETLQNIKIKQIPLKVKPVKAPKKEKTSSNIEKVKKVKQIKKEENINKFKFESTLKIVLVIILLILNTYLIISIALKVDNQKNNLINDTPYNKLEVTTSVLGKWKTQNNGLFVFQDDSNFFWYDNYQIQDNNYYYGYYNYKNGLDALEEMGYTEEEFIKTFGEDILLENVYSMNIIPVSVYKNGIDTTNYDLNENESWWFLLIIKNDGNAIGYNKTLDLRYNMIKD